MLEKYIKFDSREFVQDAGRVAVRLESLRLAKPQSRLQAEMFKSEQAELEKYQAALQFALEQLAENERYSVEQCWIQGKSPHAVDGLSHTAIYTSLKTAGEKIAAAVIEICVYSI